MFTISANLGNCGKLKILKEICGTKKISFFKVSDGVIVNTKNGVVKGRVDYSLRNISFYSYLDIPYAKAPVGDLRFSVSI